MFNYPSIPEPNHTILFIFFFFYEVSPTNRSFCHAHIFISQFLLFISESEVLIHFDGWSSDYDYWCPPDVVELHPPGWCHRNSWELQTPRGSCCIYMPHCYSTNNNLYHVGQEWRGWDEYVSRMEADKAPEHLFTPVIIIIIRISHTHKKPTEITADHAMKAFLFLTGSSGRAWHFVVPSRDEC